MIYSSTQKCNESHYIVWRPYQGTGAHPNDMEEVCIKCGEVLGMIKYQQAGFYVKIKEGEEENDTIT